MLVAQKQQFPYRYVANGAPSRLVTFQQKETLTKLGKRGIGLEVPVGFHLEERGRMIFNEQLKSLVIAKVEAFKLEFVATLLNTRSDYEVMMSDPTHQISRTDYYKQKVKLVGIINKKQNSMYKACGIVVSCSRLTI